MMAVITGAVNRESYTSKEQKVTNNVTLLNVLCQNQNVKKRLMLGHKPTH